MSFEHSDELPPDGYMGFSDEGERGDRAAFDLPPDDLPLIDETLFQGGGNGTDSEMLRDVDVAVIGALDKFGSAALDREHAQSRRDVAEEQIDALKTEALDAAADIHNAEHGMCNALAEGRKELWALVDDGSGYATGPTVLANAVRLSPDENEYESVLVREMRVRAAQELSASIQEGIPALFVREDMRASKSVATYCAGVPTHDGFSVIYYDDPNRGYFAEKFQLGINDTAIAPIIDVWDVDQGGADIGGLDEPGVTQRLGVYTGEQAAAYLSGRIANDVIAIAELNEQLTTCEGIGQWPAGIRERYYLLQDMRMNTRRDLVDVIEAGQEIDALPTLEAPGNRAMPIILCEYLFDLCPSMEARRDGDLMRVGHAMRAVYPVDAEASMVDYLVAESNTRYGAQRSYLTHAVEDVLREVCGLTDMPPDLLCR